MLVKRKASSGNSTTTIGFDAKLWLAADKLRNNMDAAEYKHVVLGLVFLKYISDIFRRVQHPDLRVDRFRKDDDVLWQFGVSLAFQQSTSC